MDSKKIKRLKEKEVEIQERIAKADQSISIYRNRQMAFKIALNSLYGALG